MARSWGAMAVAVGLAFSAGPAWAQLPSPAPSGPRASGSPEAVADPGASSELELRIARYQDLRLIFEPGPSGQPPSFRQGPDLIYESDFVALLAEPELTRHWGWLRARDWGLWLGAGALGLPLGGLVFANNFVGQGPLALFSLPAQSAKANVSDPRAFALSVSGLALAGVGLYFTGLWGAEVLDRHHPNRLDEAAIRPRVGAFNEMLKERLDLVYEKLPAPPTPRPSPSPSPSPSVDPFAQPLWAPPTPPPGSSLDYPAPLPSAMPVPLPLLEAPATPWPSPSQRPWRPLWPAWSGPAWWASPSPTASPGGGPRPEGTATGGP